MITEEQRRALFALREALRLCQSARISVVGGIQEPAVHVFCQGDSQSHVKSLHPWLKPDDVDRLLAEHPE